ncbi:MAG: hypothetical protein WCI72_01185 [archaeon]
MEVIYVPELYLYISLIFGILSSVCIVMDLCFARKNVRPWVKVTWAFFAFLLLWGPSFILWIAYQLQYRDQN